MVSVLVWNCNFLNDHAVLGEIGLNNRLAATPPFGLASPHLLGNPGSATAHKLQLNKKLCIKLWDVLVSQTIDIQAELDTINVDFSTVSILSSDTEDQLNDFKSAVDIKFTQILSEVCSNKDFISKQKYYLNSDKLKTRNFTSSYITLQR